MTGKTGTTETTGITRTTGTTKTTRTPTTGTFGTIGKTVIASVSTMVVGDGSSKVFRLHLGCVLLFDPHNGGVRKAIKILFCQATTLNRDAGYEVLVIY